MRLVFGVPVRAGVDLLATRSPVLGKGCAVWLWGYSTAGARLAEERKGQLEFSLVHRVESAIMDAPTARGRPIYAGGILPFLEQVELSHDHNHDHR